jgi:hypothetical protein
MGAFTTESGTTECVMVNPETVDWDRVSEITHRRLHMNQDWIERSESAAADGLEHSKAGG